MQNLLKIILTAVFFTIVIGGCDDTDRDPANNFDSESEVKDSGGENKDSDALKDSDAVKDSEIVDPDIVKDSEIVDPDIIKDSEIVDPDIVKDSEIVDPDIVKDSEIVDPDIIKDSEIVDPDTEADSKPNATRFGSCVKVEGGTKTCKEYWGPHWTIGTVQVNCSGGTQSSGPCNRSACLGACIRDYSSPSYDNTVFYYSYDPMPAGGIEEVCNDFSYSTIAVRYDAKCL